MRRPNLTAVITLASIHLALLVIPALAAAPATQPAGRALFARLNNPDAPFAYEYAMFMPTGPAPTGEWPLILALHGSPPADFDVHQVARDTLSGAADAADFPFIVLAPFLPADQRSWEVDSLNLLMAQTVANYPVDRTRIYCTGQSRGGFGAWALATRYPHWFAAIAPICGGGDATKVEVLKDIPHWIFHGGKDTTVLPSKSQNMAKWLKAVGCDVKLTIYPDEGHQVWDRVYKEGEVFKWFLEHRKPAPATAPTSVP